MVDDDGMGILRSDSALAAAVAAEDSYQIADLCGMRASGLLRAAPLAPEAETLVLAYLRFGVEHLRKLSPYHGSTPGFLEGATLRVYGELARLLVPTPEAARLSGELVERIEGGRAHPADLAEARSLHAEVMVQVADLEEALQACWLAVGESDGVCFHELAERVIDLALARVAAEGQDPEVLRSILSEANRPGMENHIHLWDVRLVDGELVPIDVVDRFEMDRCSDGTQVGEVLGPRRWPDRDAGESSA